MGEVLRGGGDDDESVVMLCRVEWFGSVTDGISRDGPLCRRGSCSPPADFDVAFPMDMVGQLFQSKFTGGCA
jgi:hypothetical protein